MLEKVPLFSSLSANELESLQRAAILRTYAKNTVVIERGDDTSSLYILTQGKVRVYITDEEGKEVILNVLDSPGDHFGLLALLGDTPRTASIRTMEVSRMLVISRQDFQGCVAGNPQIALAIIRSLVDQVKTLTDRVGALALKDVYARVVATLQDLAREEEGRRITPPVTQQEIAQMVGASREMVSRIFKDLRSGAYIEIQDKRIVLRKRLPARW